MFNEGYVQHPEVVAAAITGACTVLAALIAGIAAAIIGKKFAARQKLQEEKETAIKDIHFLLEVEKEHCALHKENTDESNRQRVRERARIKGYEWSGRFTPGRARPN
jgi:hypothetical protein